MNESTGWTVWGTVLLIALAILTTTAVIKSTEYDIAAQATVGEMVQAGAHPLDAACSVFGRVTTMCNIRAAVSKPRP